MDKLSQTPDSNIQAKVLLMAFQSLDRKEQEVFLEALREEIEDEALLRVLEERSQNATILSDDEEKEFRNQLRSA